MKIVTKIFCVLLLSFILQSNIFAQQTSISNLYHENGMLINPAYTGLDKAPVFYLNHRNTWAGFEGAPRSSYFGIHAPLAKQMGLGGMFSSDNRGLQREFSAQLAYSYQVNFTDSQTLTFGINGGFDSHRIDRSGISVDEEYDVLSEAQKLAADYEASGFDAGFGIRYSWKNKLEVGISAPQLFESTYDLKKHFIFNAAYKFNLCENKLMLEPYLMMRNLPYSKLAFDISVIGEWEKFLWASVGYRTNVKSFMFSGGTYVKNLGLGFSYETYRSDAKEFKASTYEIMITWKIKRDEPKVTDAKYIPPTKTGDEVAKETEYQRRLAELTNELTVLNTVKDTVTNTVRTDEVLTYVSSERIEPGFYVIVHTFTSWNTVKLTVDKLRANNMKGFVIYNKTKKTYYIYSDYNKKLAEAMKLMNKQQKKGFDSWILTY